MVYKNRFVKPIVFALFMVFMVIPAFSLDLNSSGSLQYYGDGDLDFEVGNTGDATFPGIADFSSSGITFEQPLSVESSGPFSVGSGIDLTDSGSNTIDSYSTFYLTTSSGSPSDIVLDPTGNVGINGNLNLNSNNLNNFFSSGCSSGNVAVDVNDDGTLDCVDPTSEVEGDFVSRSGDSMNGNLDMQSNNIIGIGDLEGSNIVNSGNINSGAVGSSELSGNAVTSSGGELDSSVAGNQLSYNSGSLGVVEGSGSGLNADLLDGVQLSDINWADTSMSQSDVSASDVGLGNVENIALSNAVWSDIGISQNDISVSNLGAADSNLNMNGNSITNYFGSGCGTGNVAVSVNDDGSLDCVDPSSEVQGDFVSRSGDSMTGSLDMQTNKIDQVDSINFTNGDNYGYINEYGGDALSLNSIGNILRLQDSSSTNIRAESDLELDSNAILNVDWASSDDGSGSNLDADLLDGVQRSNLNWGDMAISQSDVSKGDVGLENVENIALSGAGWSDIGISQNDVSVSNLGAADSNLDMNNNDLTDFNELVTDSGGRVMTFNNPSGGSSEIRFRSGTNTGSDYGYIEYFDDYTNSGEAGRLKLGVENDGSDDDIEISAAGDVRLNPNNGTNAGTGGNIILQGSNADLDVSGNSITNYFGSGCGSGNVAVSVNDDGSLDCVDATGEVSGDFVSRSGDSMNGNLDMSDNNVNNINKIQLNNIESVSGGQIGRDDSIGYLGNWGSNGNAVLWDSYNVQEGNAISVTGGTGDESNPQIAVNEGSISHDNIGGVSYNDHHGVGNGLTWDGNNNPAISSGGVGSNEIASGAVSTTELNTGSVDGRYVNRAGDTIDGRLTLDEGPHHASDSDPTYDHIRFVGDSQSFSEHASTIENKWSNTASVTEMAFKTRPTHDDPLTTMMSMHGDGRVSIPNGNLDMNSNSINNVDWSSSDNPNTDSQDLSYSNDNSPTGDYATHSVNIDNGNNINIRDYYDPNTDSQSLSNVVGQGNSISSGQTIDASSGSFRLPTGTDAY